MMLNNLSNIISLLSLLLTLGGLLGGIVAFRNSMTKTANEVQERVINALQTEITALRQRISDVEKENDRLHQVITTICAALKKRGLIVSIDGDLVSISDGNQTHSVRIHAAEELAVS